MNEQEFHDNSGLTLEAINTFGDEPIAHAQFDFRILDPEFGTYHSANLRVILNGENQANQTIKQIEQRALRELQVFAAKLSEFVALKLG